MKKLLILLSVAAFALVACTQEEVPVNPASGEESGDLVTFEVGFSIPTDDSPATKAMADAATINNIYIAVFGSSNYLNEFVKAVPLTSAGGAISLDGDGQYSYVKDGGVYNVRFSLKPTTSKRYVHVLANVPERSTPPDFGYVDEVLGKDLYTENNEDGYWQYLEFPSGIDGSSTTTSRFNGLKLVRNFAKVSLDPGTNFALVGFELYDTPTRGSFAAYKGKEVGGGGVTYNFYSGWGTTVATEYATVKGAYSGYLMPGATPLYRPTSSTWTNTDPKFTYEHPASEENPTFIIAKLTRTSTSETKYYRLDIVDNYGNKSPLLRNYHYTVTIDDIATDGFDTPEEALENPSDYNFTLSEKSRDAYEIENNGAFMEVDYVEKVFTKAQSDVTFRYRYTDNASVVPRVYSAGTVSAISGDGEVSADWIADAAGTGPDAAGWYTVTYDVADPSHIGSDELVSSFYVNAGEGKKMIQRRIDIVSMKKKQLHVDTWSLSGPAGDGSYTLTLSFTVPDGLRHTMFPINFKFEAYDITSDDQILSPQTDGLISSYELTSSGSIIYFLKDYFYSDYTASGGKNITIQFKSPSAVKPEVLLSDLNDYFEPLDLGGSFATGLSAAAIAKGTGHSTTLEFRANTASPMTLTLTDLTVVADPGNTVTLSGSGPYTFTPTVGRHKIKLQATTDEAVGTATIALVSPDPTNFPNSPAPLTIGRYDKYVSGSLTQGADLPLGTGQTTTFSFNYSARDLMSVTITAPGVDLSLAGGTDGTLTGSAGTYTYTPGSTGTKTFTITSKTNFADAGTISLSMPYMSNPSPLTVKRATKIVVPTGKLILDDATDFSTPMYWRTNQTHSTSGVAGSSDYFTANASGDGSNTGVISIDISSFNKDYSTPVYFMYTYTERILVFIPITRYKFASLTLSQLLSAAAGTEQTLTFS